jgi:AAA15 family ATPase/GTPase
MSDGTLRFLAIVTALLTRPEGSQIVIEEVDNGLHPSRAQLLLNMLLKLGEERQIDILVTTHDPALLDALLPDLLPSVIVTYRNPDTGESQLISLEDLENLPQIVAIGSLGQAATRGSIERSLSRRRVGVG